jgi:hypothetical protein
MGFLSHKADPLESHAQKSALRGMFGDFEVNSREGVRSEREPSRLAIPLLKIVNPNRYRMLRNFSENLPSLHSL